MQLYLRISRRVEAPRVEDRTNNSSSDIALKWCDYAFTRRSPVNFRHPPKSCRSPGQRAPILHLEHGSERQDDMATHREKFWTEDIIAAAILAASGGTTLLLTKLRAIALEQHLPLLHTIVQWWPLLLIIGGVILLFTNQVEARALGTRQGTPVSSRGYTERIHGSGN